jgi:hypothetical protein
MCIDLTAFHSVCRKFVASCLGLEDLCASRRSLLSLSGQSTIDHKSVTGDECTKTTSQLHTQFLPANQQGVLRIITSQKQSRIRNILRLPNSIPRMNTSHNSSSLIRRKLVGSHRALNTSGSKAIDVNAVASVVNSHLLGHANDLSC